MAPIGMPKVAGNEKGGDGHKQVSRIEWAFLSSSPKTIKAILKGENEKWVSL
jgi:hypothetical protein